MNHRMNALQSKDECRKKLAGQKLKFDKAQSLKFKVQQSSSVHPCLQPLSCCKWGVVSISASLRSDEALIEHLTKH